MNEVELELLEKLMHEEHELGRWKKRCADLDKQIDLLLDQHGRKALMRALQDGLDLALGDFSLPAGLDRAHEHPVAMHPAQIAPAHHAHLRAAVQRLGDRNAGAQHEDARAHQPQPLARGVLSLFGQAHPALPLQLAQLPHDLFGLQSALFHHLNQAQRLLFFLFFFCFLSFCFLFLSFCL